MATHEREITRPVDLCTPGRPPAPRRTRVVARPAAPCNLRGRFGRNKRWDYWGILAGDLLISSTFSNVDYLGIVDVWWADLATGRVGGQGATRAVPAWHPRSRTVPGTAPLRYSSKRITVEMLDDDAGTDLRATWRSATARRAGSTRAVELPPGHESLNVVIPWSDTTFQFTSKHQARPAHGRARRRRHGAAVRRRRPGVGRARRRPRALAVPHQLELGRRRRAGRGAGDDGPTSGGGAAARREVDRGDRRHRERRDRRRSAHQDRRRARVGLLAGTTRSPTWKVRAPDGSVDLVLHPRYDKHSRTEAGRHGHGGAPGVRHVVGIGPHRRRPHRGVRRSPGLRRGVPRPVVSAELTVASWNVLAAPWAAPAFYPAEMDPAVLDRVDAARAGRAASSRSSTPTSCACRRRRRSTSPRSSPRSAPASRAHSAPNGRELWASWSTDELPWETNGTAVLWRRDRFDDVETGALALSDDGNVATTFVGARRRHRHARAGGERAPRRRPSRRCGAPSCAARVRAPRRRRRAAIDVVAGDCNEDTDRHRPRRRSSPSTASSTR